MFEEKTVNENLVFDGNVIKVYNLDIVNHKNEKAKREVARHNGGACVVAIDDKENIYLVNQYRKPIEKMSLEIPAGKLEKNEDPLRCAIRELKEEAGLVAKKIVDLGFIYPSPGYCDEKLFLYMATDLKEGENNLDPGEYLTCAKVSIDECLKKIEDGTINDAKTVVAILKVSRILNK